MPGSSRKAIIAEVTPRLTTACERLNDRYADGRGHISYQYIGGYRRALVFRVDLKTDANCQQFFVKVGRDLSDSVRAFVEKEAARSQEMHEGFKPTSRLDVAQPASYDADIAVFSTHAISGQRLDLEIIESIRSGDSKRMLVAHEYLVQCGEWLEDFQALTPDDNKLIETDELMVSVSRQLDRLARTDSERFNKTFIDKVSDALLSCAQNMPLADRQQVLRHDDYAPWNVMCDKGKVIVFDFPNIQPGAKHYDRFYFRGALLTLGNKLRVSKREIQRLCQSFDESLPEASRPAAESVQYYALLFSLVRLGALVHLDKPGLLRGLLNSVRVRKEIDVLNTLASETIGR